MGVDPLVSAYEHFFAAYDPEERAGRGVYYTPASVVRYQVSGVQSLLRETFGLSGVTDRQATFLDPATGTGTYVLELIRTAAEEFSDAGAPMDVALREFVGERLDAFEIMIGPYAVAHQRVAALLDQHGAAADRRLPIFLVDSLAEALVGATGSRFGPLGTELAEERAAAEHVKTEKPVLVVIGNPPYDRIKRSQLGDEWLLALIQDLVERTPKSDRRNLKALYDFYVAFWRWSAWLVAERPLGSSSEPQGRAIIAFITNRSWLVGRGFGGLRSLISSVASQVWVLDLGGDLRTSSTRVADQNVFDIGVGVAITFVVVDPDSGVLPAVHYRRLWGTRADKEAELNQGFSRAAFAEVVRSSPTDPFPPVEWGALTSQPSIEKFFTQHETGVQTSRPFLIGLRDEDVLGFDGSTPVGSVGRWSALEEPERTGVFHPTRTHPVAPSGPVDEGRIVRYAYRPLDYRSLYNDPAFIEWPRPALQSAFRIDNVALVSIERGFGQGPAAFPICALPDLHVFRGFGGARGVYPLYRGPDGALGGQLAIGTSSTAVNLAPIVIEWADAVLGSWEPLDVFGYATAALGAPAYTATFESGLMAERPRIPLSVDKSLVRQASALGRELVELWSLRGSISNTVVWRPGDATAATLGQASWEPPGSIRVAGRTLDGVSEAAWAYQVSGYDVIQRWCRDRSENSADVGVLDELRLVVSAVTRILELGPTLDDLLGQICSGPLAGEPR